MKQTMEQELRLQQNNKGFSLVELIVTILISSVVMLAVVGLLTTGLNLYKNVNAETQLQIEAQAACGRIEELVQEAQYLEFSPVAVGTSNNKALVLLTLEDTGDDWWYYIVWDEAEKQLLLAKTGVTYNNGFPVAPDTVAISTQVTNMLGASNKKRYLLAQYIKEFDFSSKKIDESATLYNISLTLEMEGKQFITNQFIDGRNN